ncbi:MAG: hypothetical protein WCI01_08475 [Chlorobiaceae bacterium]
MATMVECSEGGALALFPASGMTEWNGTVVARRVGDRKAKTAFALLPIERKRSRSGESEANAQGLHDHDTEPCQLAPSGGCLVRLLLLALQKA